MLDKDKLFIIYYLDLEGVDMSTANEMLCNCYNHFSNMYDESVNFIVVPCRNGLEHNKVEALRGDLLTDEQLETFKRYSDEFIKWTKDNVNSK